MLALVVDLFECSSVVLDSMSIPMDSGLIRSGQKAAFAAAGLSRPQTSDDVSQYSYMSKPGISSSSRTLSFLSVWTHGLLQL